MWLVSGVWIWWRELTCAVAPDDDEERRPLDPDTLFVEPVHVNAPLSQQNEIPWSEMMRLHLTPQEPCWPPKPHLGRKVSMMKDQWETIMNGVDWKGHNDLLKQGPGQDRVQRIKVQLNK